MVEAVLRLAHVPRAAGVVAALFGQQPITVQYLLLGVAAAASAPRAAGDPAAGGGGVSGSGGTPQEGGGEGKTERGEGQGVLGAEAGDGEGGGGTRAAVGEEARAG